MLWIHIFESSIFSNNIINTKQHQLCHFSPISFYWSSSLNKRASIHPSSVSTDSGTRGHSVHSSPSLLSWGKESMQTLYRKGSNWDRTNNLFVAMLQSPSSKQTKITLNNYNLMSLPKISGVFFILSKDRPIVITHMQCWFAVGCCGRQRLGLVWATTTCRLVWSLLAVQPQSCQLANVWFSANGFT